ncbi:kinase-like domain-containing protein [Thelephora terrestris]|uniref:Kinase-like domain-containing protein n=1 Tax=Thelephora terrestris TaxID=56493 RepID=A0A9P6L369_9AGAM|nr:kinase-like domain-containing protein [Thelephora terrestris]
MATLEEDMKQCENNAKSPADAQKVVDQLDQLLDEKLDPSKKKKYLMSLMKICKAYCFVPTSHLILDDKLQKEGENQPGETDVWLGYYGEKFVLIKVFSKYEDEDEKAIKRRLCREAVVWKRISHPNILPFIGVTLSKELAVVYPCMQNVLDHLAEDHEVNAVKLLEESAIGLKYLHDSGLVHGGLQGKYILVDDDGHACLGNVGHASITREHGDTVLGQRSTVAGDGGHFRYYPPEFLKDEPGAKPHATKQSDIYSMGMTIYEVLTGEKPFKEIHTLSVVMPIINGIRPKKPTFLFTRGYTEELWNLTTACWQQDPAARPPVDQVLESLRDGATKWGVGKS